MPKKKEAPAAFAAGASRAFPKRSALPLFDEGANKDLGRFADQIRALIKKWER